MKELCTCGYIGICEASSQFKQLHSQIHKEFEANEETNKNRNNDCDPKQAGPGTSDSIENSTHEKEYQYECKHCKLRFENENNLTGHICNIQEKIESITDHEEEAELGKEKPDEETSRELPEYDKAEKNFRRKRSLNY